MYRSKDFGAVIDKLMNYLTTTWKDIAPLDPAGGMSNAVSGEARSQAIPVAHQLVPLHY